MHRSTFADDADMRDLIEMYIRDLPEKVEALTRLLGEGQLEPLRKVAHQLKGSGGGYGFNEITQLAAAVDRSVKDGAEFVQVQRQVVELIQYLTSVEGYAPPTAAKPEQK